MPPPSIDRHGIALRSIALALMAALAVMQCLLWRFLGMGSAWQVAGGATLLACGIALARAPGWQGRLPWPVLAVSLVVALVLLLLGGEGDLFYAPPDWQVRYAVLRDLTLHPWPFALGNPGGVLVLRSPLGMYLGPALVGKLAGGFKAARLAMLAQNTVLLALIQTLGAGIFTSARQRWIALGVFWGFSGMDVVGQAIARRPLTLHLETWAGMQFSSHVTQIFWVPQHAMAGWMFAASYLLWWQGKVPARLLYAQMPLLALVSPLALMGCVPFAAHAFVAQLLGRRLAIADIVLPALVGAVSLPSLLYLTAASDTVAVSTHAGTYAMAGYPLFILLEIGGFAFALWRMRRQQPFGIAASLVTLAVLLVAPFIHIGDSMDFVARASIPALAVLALMMASILLDGPREARRWVLIVGLIGLATPIGEIARAIAWPASPEVTCGYLGVIPRGYGTYTARLDRLPRPIRPQHAALVPLEPAHPCWARPWRDPITGQAMLTHPY